MIRKKLRLLLNILLPVFGFVNLLGCNSFDSTNKNQNIVEDTIPEIIEQIMVFDSLKSGLNFIKGTNYKETKIDIAEKKQQYAIKYKSLNEIDKDKYLDSLQLVFENHLLNEIIPYWYGTPWDFNGYTAIPNKGKIACGYFVSTTLKHMGVNINRYKLAQQNPENEARTIAIMNNNLLTSEAYLDEVLKELKVGLYFIGVGNHVGFLYKNKDSSYIIHANYIENRVMLEDAVTSPAFGSAIYHISSISTNKTFLKSWLLDKKIEVIGTH